MSTCRTALLRQVAQKIVSLDLQRPTRVAVDGRSGAGKTTLADELAVAITGLKRPVIRASIDSFHMPAAVRYRKGRLSPDGYYEDARDLEALCRLLLDPLGPGGDGVYATEAFDIGRDQPLHPELRRATSDAVLIVDGTFLQKAELRSNWDFVLFVDVPEAEARVRAIKRDSAVSADWTDLNMLYEQRYEPASMRYEIECKPMHGADLIIDNRDLQSPKLV